jgi:hypothetical protein
MENFISFKKQINSNLKLNQNGEKQFDNYLEYEK